jgi:16S rRNA (cytosine967-C5)-methyltransferase
MPAPAPAPDSPGLPARRIAADVLESVLRKRQPLDDAFADATTALATLEERDRALVRMLVSTILRRLGTLRHLISRALDRGLPDNAPQVDMALLIGAAQILFLEVPDHAAVDLAVRLVQGHRHTVRYAGLVNAVLRKIARERGKLAALDPALDTPDWLMRRWTTHYGADTARAIAVAHAHEPALDITVKSDLTVWAERLGGKLLPNGSVRLIPHGPVPSLPGFDEGQWWVQDAAAALPAHLLGDVRGKKVADLCAAPGGKSAQLANAGALVTAVDRSAPRLKRLTENFARLHLSCEGVVADAAQWNGGPFDAVLLDAPCTATGTIRRHPDIPWLKSERDLQKLTQLQRRLLDHALMLLAPLGRLVYCTCSLEPEEGEQAIEDLLRRAARVQRLPITASEIFGLSEFVTPAGDLRTLPCHWPDADSRMSGLDGFFAARLIRT